MRKRESSHGGEVSGDPNGQPTSKKACPLPLLTSLQPLCAMNEPKVEGVNENHPCTQETLRGQ
jgi:hypothetical protein